MGSIRAGPFGPVVSVSGGGRGSTLARIPTAAVLGAEPAFPEPILVTRALAPDPASLAERLRGIVESRWFTNDGPVVRTLESLLRDHLGAPCSAAFCNGTTALQAALRCLEIRGEVVTTPFTFPATVHAITWCGLKPVFCDVDPESYNLDPAAVEQAVGPETSALLPVHCFGNPCDVTALQAIADRAGLRIVYDAAHAFGVEHRGRPIATYGDLSVFSFHATKVFHTAEGGAVLGSDPALFETLSMLRNFAIVDEDEVNGLGVNGKMSEVHAAIGLSVFDAAKIEYAERAALAAHYRETVGKLDGVVFQRKDEAAKSNGAYLAVEIDAETFGLSRDELHAALRAENVVPRKYFSPLCSQNPFYANEPSAHPGNLPNAHRLASRVLCLPLYGALGVDGVERIADAMRNIQALAPRIRVALGGI